MLRIAFSPEGKHLIGASATGTATWSLDSNALARTVAARGNVGDTGIVAISNHGVLATADSDGLWLRDLSRPKPDVTLLAAPTDAVFAAFDASGSSLAVFHGTRGVTVWDVGHRRKVAEFKIKRPTDSLLDCQAIAFSPDGRILAVLESESTYHDHVACSTWLPVIV